MKESKDEIEFMMFCFVVGLLIARIKISIFIR